jgi:hypothetical protein
MKEKERIQDTPKVIQDTPKVIQDTLKVNKQAGRSKAKGYHRCVRHRRVERRLRDWPLSGLTRLARSMQGGGGGEISAGLICAHSSECIVLVYVGEAFAG